MTTAFPAALDTYGDPGGIQVQGSTTPTHSGHHTNHNDAIEALEAKLGTGSSTATASTVLRGTGAGASAFGQVQTGDIVPQAVHGALNTTILTASQTTTANAPPNAMSPTTPMSVANAAGSDVQVTYYLRVSNSLLNHGIVIYLYVDGVISTELCNITEAIAGGGWSITGAFYLSGLSAGTHTYGIHWWVSSGTASLGSGRLDVREVKR